MEQFAKLTNNFIIDSYTLRELQTSYSTDDSSKEFKGISYYNVACTNSVELYNVIPERYRKDFYFSLLYINDAIPPHTDSSDKAVINFYVKPNDCVTQFYNLKTTSPRLSQVKNQTDGFLFDLEDLDETDKFKAAPNEAWVLDTTAVHSVNPTVNFSERVAVQLGTATYRFKEVIDMLRETGNL